MNETDDNLKGFERLCTEGNDKSLQETEAKILKLKKKITALQQSSYEMMKPGKTSPANMDSDIDFVRSKNQETRNLLTKIKTNALYFKCSTLVISV